MAKTLTDAGLSVVALERGPARDTSPDFEYPRIIDELKYAVRGDLWQPLAKETVTVRHNLNEVPPPIASTAHSSLATGSAAPAFTGTASCGEHRRKISGCEATSRSDTGRVSFPKT